jgi:hypothetical protein
MEPLVEYVERVDVWAATIEDKPGGLARVLAELREEGADLQFIISRRAEPGKGVVFVTPLRGDREIAAAAQVGFNVAHTLHSVRIMGQDRPGVAAEVTQKLANVVHVEPQVVVILAWKRSNEAFEELPILCAQGSESRGHGRFLRQSLSGLQNFYHLVRIGQRVHRRDRA